MFNLYKDCNYESSGSLDKLALVTKLSHTTLQRMAQYGLSINGYTIYKVVKKQEIKPIIKPIQKTETELECIIRHLEEYGNTILIKKELKYLDQLKEMYDLDIREFNPQKYKLCIGKNSREPLVHDWVITIRKKYGKSRSIQK